MHFYLLLINETSSGNKHIYVTFRFASAFFLFCRNVIFLSCRIKPANSSRAFYRFARVRKLIVHSTDCREPLSLFYRARSALNDRVWLPQALRDVASRAITQDGSTLTPMTVDLRERKTVIYGTNGGKRHKIKLNVIAKSRLVKPSLESSLKSAGRFMANISMGDLVVCSFFRGR